MLDQAQATALIVAAVVGLISVVLILRRERHAAEAAARESPFAVATEGMKRCPACGFANLVSDATCSACGRDIPG